MINKIDDGSASLSFPDFNLLIREKAKEVDPETHFKDTFRVFSKDEEGGFLNYDMLWTRFSIQDAFPLMR